MLFVGLTLSLRVGLKTILFQMVPELGTSEPCMTRLLAKEAFERG